MVKSKKHLIFISFIIVLGIIFSFNAYADHTNEMMVYKINNSEVTITGGGTSEYVNIPNYIEDYPVTKIANHAFALNPYYKGVTLPETLVTIDDEAIISCENIKEITIPKSVQNIGSRALGYEMLFYDNNGVITCNYNKMYDFIIKGYKGTTAETYANKNGFTFIALDYEQVTTTVPVTTDVPTTETTVVTTTSTSSTEDVTTSTTVTTTSDVAATSKVTSTSSAVTTTSITTFETQTTTSQVTDTKAIPGDANEDGKLNVRDCACIASKLAQDKKDELPECADYNDDKKVDVRDAAAIAKFLAGYQSGN